MRARLGFMVFIGLFAGFFAVGGVLTYRDQRDGAPGVATVTDCRERLARYGGDICRGSWVTDDGRSGSGTVEGVNHGDEGERVEVRVIGERAVVPGMRLSIVLWSIAAAVLLLGGFQMLKDRRMARKPSPVR